MNEDQESYPKEFADWIRFRIAPGFVIECDCQYGTGEFGTANEVVTGVLVHQEVRGADGRMYYANLKPSWGSPSNGPYNMQEKRP